MSSEMPTLFGQWTWSQSWGWGVDGEFGACRAGFLPQRLCRERWRRESSSVSIRMAPLALSALPGAPALASRPLEKVVQQLHDLSLPQVHPSGQRVILIANQASQSLQFLQQLAQVKQQLGSSCEPGWWDSREGERTDECPGAPRQAPEALL